MLCTYHVLYTNTLVCSCRHHPSIYLFSDSKTPNLSSGKFLNFEFIIWIIYWISNWSLLLILAKVWLLILGKYMPLLSFCSLCVVCLARLLKSVNVEHRKFAWGLWVGGLLSFVWTHHAYGIEFDLLHRQYAKRIIISFTRFFLKTSCGTHSSFNF